jgi:hypothetical protein
MKLTLKKLMKQLLHAAIAMLRTQPRLKRLALSLLYKVPRLKMLAFKALTAPTPRKKHLARLDRWGETIHKSLVFRRNQHRSRVKS